MLDASADDTRGAKEYGRKHPVHRKWRVAEVGSRNRVAWESAAHDGRSALKRGTTSDLGKIGPPLAINLAHHDVERPLHAIAGTSAIRQPRHSSCVTDRLQKQLLRARARQGIDVPSLTM